jgi:3-keto-5-aminohexanoate cleavage enzyme
MSEPVIVQAAITGSITDRATTPHVPMSIEENVDAAVAAWRAGASIIHLHAREEDGTPTQRVDRFVPLVEGIRAKGCDAVLNLSTGSAGGRASGAERYAVAELQPELASYDCGSVNMGDWVFSNPLPFLRDMAQTFLDRGVKPEIECFDSGHVMLARRLRDEGLLEPPLYFQFVLGVAGGAPPTLHALHMLLGLLPEGSIWSACGIGRGQLDVNLLSLVAGGHVRTGLEDNVYYRRGELAISNAQLVERVVRIAGEYGRSVASPDEARELLGLRPGAAR